MANTASLKNEGGAFHISARTHPVCVPLVGARSGLHSNSVEGTPWGDPPKSKSAADRRRQGRGQHLQAVISYGCEGGNWSGSVGYVMAQSPLSRRIGLRPDVVAVNRRL
jgi:hypothetical protein